VSSGAAAIRSHDSESDEGLWTVADVARYLKASRSWVYHRAESGELPCLRVGGLLRFDPEAIRAYARGQPVGQSTSSSRLARALGRGER
jgi:excisionase family DNA binding protein